tara:strand:- start:511 stop:711 length:201 start_codon:yes stop_codon:yes gene_type:complete
MKVGKLIEMLKDADEDQSVQLHIFSDTQGWMVIDIEKIGYHEQGTLISGGISFEKWQKWEDTPEWI